MKTTSYSVSQHPTAHIAISRNRVKHYGYQVYLKNGTSFEIELFNPKQAKVLAKIFINGQSISGGGIVLQPGQRVFLERWIDASKKFLFETYEVESSDEAARAIEKNGDVRVEFYDQIFVASGPYYSQPLYYTGPISPLTSNSSTATFDSQVLSDYRPSITFGGTTANYSSVIVGESTTTTNCSTVNCSVETGRVEVGESSSQQLSFDDSKFSSICATRVDLKILPESAKPVEISEIRNYCHGCGTRVKSSSWKFCPSCGLELE